MDDILALLNPWQQRFPLQRRPFAHIASATGRSTSGAVTPNGQPSSRARSTLVPVNDMLQVAPGLSLTVRSLLKSPVPRLQRRLQPG